MANMLRFDQLVVEDLIRATKWYDEISLELGDRFRSAVDARFESIEINPESYGFARGTIRAAMVPGFPYVVLFEHGVGVTTA